MKPLLTLVFILCVHRASVVQTHAGETPKPRNGDKLLITTAPRLRVEEKVFYAFDDHSIPWHHNLTVTLVHAVTLAAAATPPA